MDIQLTLFSTFFLKLLSPTEASLNFSQTYFITIAGTEPFGNVEYFKNFRLKSFTLLVSFLEWINMSNKFWAHFKVELKLVKSCLGEFWITGFIWLSYSSNDTFIVSKTYLQCIYIDREECVSVSAFYNSNTVFWVLKNVNPIQDPPLVIDSFKTH